MTTEDKKLIREIISEVRFFANEEYKTRKSNHSQNWINHFGYKLAIRDLDDKLDDIARKYEL